MADDLKAEDQHQRDLVFFLKTILQRVTKQAEDIRNFERAKLLQFIMVPPKVHDPSKEKAPRPDLRKKEDPKREKAKTRDRKPDTENKDRNRSTCDACGREKEAYAIFQALQKLEHLLRDTHFLLRY